MIIVSRQHSPGERSSYATAYVSRGRIDSRPLGRIVVAPTNQVKVSLTVSSHKPGDLSVFFKRSQEKWESKYGKSHMSIGDDALFFHRYRRLI